MAIEDTPGDPAIIYDKRFPDKSKEEIIEAIEAVNKKHHENYMQIDFSYIKIIVPYLAGVEILKQLKEAELVSNDIAWDYLKIIPMNTEAVSSIIVARETYIEWKMRTLLKITKKPEDPF